MELANSNDRCDSLKLKEYKLWRAKNSEHSQGKDVLNFAAAEDSVESEIHIIYLFTLF